MAVVLRCAPALVQRARYVFDTLFMALGIGVDYVDRPPGGSPWLLYAPDTASPGMPHRCIAVTHAPRTWNADARSDDIAGLMPASCRSASSHAALDESPSAGHIDFDLPALAFHFLASVPERVPGSDSRSRRLYADSAYASAGVAQDVVDRLLDVLRRGVQAVQGFDQPDRGPRPSGSAWGVALTHDVDFVPSGRRDVLVQGAKTIARHALRQRDPASALRAGLGLARALAAGRDPYGCIPEIIAGEKARGVRSSFQIAVARRHPADVNYDVRDDRVRDYLRAITDAGFDLCLHGSYRSTERIEWYVEETALLGERLARPLGSRQHYLSFDYDTLFRAQEAAGIRYDMSIGYPDRCGPRAGFSFPYFPYCLEEERPYDVLEIPLFYMDVTLQSYMRLSPPAAWEVLESGLQDLKRKGGAVSVVWHPIVFGGARDPGYDQLYWRLVERVRELGGVATDGRTIHDDWRRRARSYASFAHLSA